MIKFYYIKTINAKRLCRNSSEYVEVYDELEKNKKDEIHQKIDEHILKEAVSPSTLDKESEIINEENDEDEENDVFIQYNAEHDDENEENEEEATEVSLEHNSFKLFKKVYFSNFKKKVSGLTILNSELCKKINIRITQNNIFCSLINLINNKTIHVSSSGIYKTKITKRKLKHVIEMYLRKFFLEIQSYNSDFDDTIFNIIASPKNRKKIIGLLQEILEEDLDYDNLVIDFKSKKCFNGCRVTKKIRRKRRRNRIFKR